MPGIDQQIAKRKAVASEEETEPQVKISAYLPTSRHRELRLYAAEHNISVNSLLTVLLDDYLAAGNASQAKTLEKVRRLTDQRRRASRP